MSMSEIGLEPKFYYPKGKQSFQERVPWTDDECILISLDNCRNLAGLDKNQVERIIKERMAPPKYFPNRLMRRLL
jgi:hypothetical protein